MAEQSHPPPDAPAIVPQVVAEHEGIALDHGQQAGQRPQQRGLPGAVRSPEQHDLPAGDVEVDTGQRGEAAEQRDRGAEVDDRLEHDLSRVLSRPRNRPTRSTSLRLVG